jgi:hypothetical protein
MTELVIKAVLETVESLAAAFEANPTQQLTAAEAASVIRAGAAGFVDEYGKRGSDG